MVKTGRGTLQVYAAVAQSSSLPWIYRHFKNEFPHRSSLFLACGRKKPKSPQKIVRSGNIVNHLIRCHPARPGQPAQAGFPSTQGLGALNSRIQAAAMNAEVSTKNRLRRIRFQPLPTSPMGPGPSPGHTGIVRCVGTPNRVSLSFSALK